MGGSVSRYVRVSLLRPTLLLLFFSFPGIIFAQPAPLTLPANMKGVQYFPRGHAWWNMLYDWYTLDCSTTTLSQSDCVPGQYVYQIVQNDLATLAANGVNYIHVYIWDQDRALSTGPNLSSSESSTCQIPVPPSPPLVPAGCTYPGFVGWDNGGAQTSPNNQWNALIAFVSAAKANGLWVVVHFAPGRISTEMSKGAPVGSACANNYAVGTTGFAACIGSEYGTWVGDFISALASYQNVLIWGLNWGTEGPVPSDGGYYNAFWEAAYPTILSTLQQYPYSSPSGRALTMAESGFAGVWPPTQNPDPPDLQAVQPILSLQQWTYPGNPGYTATGYQWNWQEAPDDPLSVQDSVSAWQQAGIQPDLWAFQVYGASAADLEAALECVAGEATSVCPSPTQAVPFSKMIVSEVATGSSLAASPIGNGFSTVGDAQDPTTDANGQAQWLTDTLCVFSRHNIPAFSWFGLYDSASWWEANYSSSAVQLAWDGYWGLSSELSSYGNKTSWTSFLDYPSDCPSAVLPPAPVLGIYTDAPYYTQGDTGIVAYTAADVTSLSLNEPPDSGVYSCETSDEIESASNPPSATPLVGSCSALYVTMDNLTSQITISGSNTDVDNSPFGYQTNGSASTTVTVGPTPIVGGVQNNNTQQTCDYTQNPNCTITASQEDTIVVYGQGFTPTGGNTMNIADWWLYETDGYYYWDSSRTQINAQIGCYIPPGSYTFNVHNPNSANGEPSASYSIDIVSSPSCQ